MINNSWSNNYFADRLMWAAENYGITVLLLTSEVATADVRGVTHEK
jgi:hypothetical protein